MSTTLFTQVYPNIIRQISGLTNTVAQTDYILNCDTSTGAVALELPSIPLNYWSTQWRIVVVDYGNNAAVNNITINAPSGFKINGQPSMTINANGASYYITVGNNTNFVAFWGGLNSGGSGASLISVTNAQLLTLISTSSIIAGQFYLVTDALYSDGGVIVQGAIANQSTTVNGSGIFLNADYQATGVYSGVTSPPYLNNLGIWYETSTAPAGFGVGSVCIYNNRMYICVSPATPTWWNGVSGSNPSTDNTNWQILTKSATTGYITEVDQVRYDITNNRVIYRADKRGNEVDLYITGGTNSLTYFQWGRATVINNKLVGNSYFNCQNSFCSFNGNVCTNGIIADVTPYSVGGSGSFNKNNVTNSSLSVTVANRGTIEGNNIEEGAVVVIENAQSGRGLYTCRIANIAATLQTISSNISNKRCETGFSNFDTTLSMSGSQFTANTLTLDPVYHNHIGIFYMRSWGDVWIYTENASNNFPQTFIPVAPLTGTNQFRITPVASVASNCHVGNATTMTVGTNFVLTPRTSASDSIIMQQVRGSVLTVNNVIIQNTIG